MPENLNTLSVIRDILLKLRENDYRSYDHYDLWGSRFGASIKGKRLLLPIVGTLYISDILFPSVVRTLFFKPTRSPEVTPYIIRALLLLWEETGKEFWKEDALMLYRYLLSVLGSTSHGKGLGLQFYWYSEKLLPPHTPCVTISSYWVDTLFLLEEKELISSEEAERELKAVGRFVYKDLHFTQTGEKRGKISYAEANNLFAVNANSYGAKIMHQLGKRFKNEEYLLRASLLCSYVCSEQNSDGSWFYFDKSYCSEKNNFIDCFHTAYVLENLYYLCRETGDKTLLQNIRNGLSFYRNAFILPTGEVRHFHRSHLPVEVKTDIRSIAQTLQLFSLLSPLEPELIKEEERILRHTFDTMYDESRHFFYFRTYRFFTSRMNYLRWGNGPMLNALVSLYRLQSFPTPSKSN